MFKLFIASILLALCVQANILDDKIENLIGSQDFNKHKNLINFIFKDTKKYMLSENINYSEVIKSLQENGLLKLSFAKPKDVIIEFHTNKDPVKSLKILKDSLKSLGYYYYFTKSTRFDGLHNLIWTIKLTTEAAIDPLVLSNELVNKNCRILDISKEENDKWIYKINTQNSTLSDTISIINGERVSLKKPLKPYMIKVSPARQLYIASRILNKWSPHIVFYDKHLNILEVIKKDRVHRNLRISIPQNTQYIKISDLYALINIKRGLSVVIKE